MIVVVGGCASGKRTFAGSLGYAEADMARGVIDARPVLLDLQQVVMDRLRNLDERSDGLPQAEALADDVRELACALADKQVVACREVGNGIVPVDPVERLWREQTGRVLGLLAERADCVVRMVCGIPVALKGELPQPRA